MHGGYPIKSASVSDANVGASSAADLTPHIRIFVTRAMTYAGTFGLLSCPRPTSDARTSAIRATRST